MVTFILKRPVTDAAERMLKLLTRTNIGGLKAAPPPSWQPTLQVPTRIILYYTDGTRYGVIPLTRHTNCLYIFVFLNKKNSMRFKVPIYNTAFFSKK